MSKKRAVFLVAQPVVVHDGDVILLTRDDQFRRLEAGIANCDKEIEKLSAESEMLSADKTRKKGDSGPAQRMKDIKAQVAFLEARKVQIRIAMETAKSYLSKAADRLENIEINLHRFTFSERGAAESEATQQMGMERVVNRYNYMLALLEGCIESWKLPASVLEACGMEDDAVTRENIGLLPPDIINGLYAVLEEKSASTQERLNFLA